MCGSHHKNIDSMVKLNQYPLLHHKSHYNIPEGEQLRKDTKFKTIMNMLNEFKACKKNTNTQINLKRIVIKLLKSKKIQTSK